MKEHSQTPDAIRKREKRAANRDAILAQERARRAANRERIREQGRAWDRANAEKRRAMQRAAYAQNPAKWSAWSAEWRAANRDLKREIDRSYRSANWPKIYATYKEWRELNRHITRKHSAAWAKKNPGKRNASFKRYMTKLFEQLHPSADLALIEEVYIKCARVSSESGIAHEVDHIIPLDSGGWHHQANLQILPAALNSQKGRNPFWERPGFLSWRDVPQELWPANLAADYAARLSSKSQ